MIPPPAPLPPSASLTPYIPPAPPPPAPDPAKLEEDIRLWQILVEELRELKEKEMTLRKSVAERTFNRLPSGALPEGTNRTTFDGPSRSFELKMISKWDRQIDGPTFLANRPKLLEAAIPVDLLVKVEYNLAKSVYNTLNTQQQKLADEMILVKQGGITLEAEELPPK